MAMGFYTMSASAGELLGGWCNGVLYGMFSRIFPPSRSTNSNFLLGLKYADFHDRFPRNPYSFSKQRRYLYKLHVHPPQKTQGGKACFGVSLPLVNRPTGLLIRAFDSFFFTCAILQFAISTAHVALNLRLLINAFLNVSDGPSASEAYLAQETIPEQIGMKVLYFANVRSSPL
jgi:hypothetical protein